MVADMEAVVTTHQVVVVAASVALAAEAIVVVVVVATAVATVEVATATQVVLVAHLHGGKLFGVDPTCTNLHLRHLGETTISNLQKHNQTPTLNTAHFTTFFRQF